MTVHALNAYWHPDYPDLRVVGPRWRGACVDHGTLRLVTPPASLPVTTEEMRAQVRQDQTADDDLLDAYAAAATQTVEDETGRALMLQTWELALETVPGWETVLPIAPLVEVTEVATRTADGAESIVPPSSYLVFAPSGPTCGRGHLRILSGAGVWPGVAWGDGTVVAIRFTVGHALPAQVPAPLRAAVKMLAADLYETREATAAGAARALTANPTHARLLAPYRLLGWGR